MKYLSKSLSDTKKFAVKLARQLRGGEVIGLTGELGSGKTTFTQYLAAALGVKQTVNSPTFNIIKVYPIMSLRACLPAGRECKRRGNLVIHGIASPTARNDKKSIRQFVHIDAYRLRSPQELKALGAQEYFQNKNAVTVIEWANKVKPILPKNITLIKFRLNKTSRLITIFRHWAALDREK